MKTIKNIVIIAFTLILGSCASNETKTVDRYHLKKKYWNVEDYKNMVYQINYLDKGESKPNYRDPLGTTVLKKFMDKENVTVVMNDESLGLSHRSDFVEGVFDQYRKILGNYRETDREDKYVYAQELIDLQKFGLFIQLHYFDLGNMLIIQNSDDPEEKHTQNILRGNEKTLVGNFDLYLNHVKRESSLTPVALESFADGITQYFPLLLEKYPKANVASMENKVEAMIKKAKNPKVLAALISLSEKLKTRSELHQIDASIITPLD